LTDPEWLYAAAPPGEGTHLALRLRGRIRYIVPRRAAERAACWETFRPGRTEIPFRLMARLPRLSGADACVEGVRLAAIRQVLGNDAGVSCCRAGGGGVWSKLTLLFPSRTKDQPHYLVKAGAGPIDDRFLRNEAEWLCALRSYPSLAEHIPEMIAHRSGTDLCFLAQRALPGDMSFSLGAPHFDFLRKLHGYSLHELDFGESVLRQNLLERISALEGKLPGAWSARLRKGMQKVDRALSGRLLLMTAAHNDFTPWNIRLHNGRAYVFDWEFAAHEQLPLFDPLHFVLMQRALKGGPADALLKRISQALELCRRFLGADWCAMAEVQVLAYFLNVCTLHLCDDASVHRTDPAMHCYADVIDHLVEAAFQTDRSKG
jgi:hypothetical protein